MTFFNLDRDVLIRKLDKGYLIYRDAYPEYVFQGPLTNADRATLKQRSEILKRWNTPYIVHPISVSGDDGEATYPNKFDLIELTTKLIGIHRPDGKGTYYAADPVNGVIDLDRHLISSKINETKVACVLLSLAILGARLDVRRSIFVRQGYIEDDKDEVQQLPEIFIIAYTETDVVGGGGLFSFLSDGLTRDTLIRNMDRPKVIKYIRGLRVPREFRDRKASILASLENRSPGVSRIIPPVEIEEPAPKEVVYEEVPSIPPTPENALLPKDGIVVNKSISNDKILTFIPRESTELFRGPFVVGLDADTIKYDNLITREKLLKGWNARHILYSKDTRVFRNTMSGDGVKCMALVYDNVFGDPRDSPAPITVLSMLREGKVDKIEYSLLRTFMLLYLLNADYGLETTFYSHATREVYIYYLEESAPKTSFDIPCHGDKHMYDICRQTSHFHAQQLARDLAMIVIPSDIPTTNVLRHRLNGIIQWLAGLGEERQNDENSRPRIHNIDTRSAYSVHMSSPTISRREGSIKRCTKTHVKEGVFAVCKASKASADLKRIISDLHSRDCDAVLELSDLSPDIITYIVCMVTEEGKVLGFFISHIHEEEEGATHTIWNVCVGKKHRGNSLAKRMIELYIETTVQNGEKLWLATSPDSKSWKAAIMTYARIGFANPRIGDESPEGYVLPPNETVVLEYVKTKNPPTSSQVDRVVSEATELAHR